MRPTLTARRHGAGGPLGRARSVTATRLAPAHRRAAPLAAAAPRAGPAPGGASAGAGAPPPEPALSQRRCEPCEAAKEAEAMGLASAFDSATAARYLARLQPGWRLVTDEAGRLRVRRRVRTKNFLKGLELVQRIGAVAEAEGHHPDLALEGWNNATITLWTHARGGLTENDFIVAAKIDALDLADLLSKKQPDPDAE